MPRTLPFSSLHLYPARLLGLVLATVFVSPGGLRAQVELWRDGRSQPPLYPTLQAAVDAAQPGDTLRVRPGVYHENIRITGKHAPAGRPFTIEAAQSGTTGAVVFDGADPELQRASPERPIARWTPLPDPSEGWEASVPWTWTNRESRALHTWASHADERLIAAHHNEEFFRKGPRGDALYRVGTAVKLRLVDGRDPNTVPLNIGMAEGIIQFTDSSGWIVRDLELRHAGFAGVHLNGSDVSDITLEDLTVQTAHYGIATEELGAESKRIFIRRCRVLNFWNFDWEWRQGYQDSTASNTDEFAPMRGNGIRLKAEDSEISDCEIAGTWDGMMVQGRRNRVYRNLFHHIADDMIELESGRSTDIEFYDNVGFKLFSGISVVSNRPGPIYIYRNRVQTTDIWRGFGDTYRYGYPIKMGSDWGPGASGLYFYQNTFVSKGRSVFVVARSPRYQPRKWDNLAFVNNIFLRTREKAPVGLEGMGPAANNIRWEGNLFSWGADLERLKELDAAYATAGTIGNPRLADSAADPVDARLASDDSPARAAGSLLARKEGWPDSYPDASKSSLPDIGAIPYDAAPHTAGPGGALYWPWKTPDI